MSATCDMDTHREVDARIAPEISALIKGISSLVLSGSGSSEFAGDCVRMVLQRELVIDAQAIAGVLCSRMARTRSRSGDLG